MRTILLTSQGCGEDDGGYTVCQSVPVPGTVVSDVVALCITGDLEA